MKVWEYFEHLSDVVYVTDMETDELIYLNERGRTAFGFSSSEEYIGKKCYEVLQGSAAPCAMCTNKELKPFQFKDWNFFNPALQRHLRLRDTMIVEDGKKYRMEIAIDDEQTIERINAIKSYQNLEAFANEGIRIALEAPTPDMCIDTILEYIGKGLHADRTYVFEKNPRGNDDNTYEWCAAGIRPFIDVLQDLPAEVCAKWYGQFNIDKPIRIKDLEDIREIDPLQYENLKRQDIHSLVVVPLYDNKQIIGFYGADNPPEENLEYSKNMLQILSHFIASSLRRRSLLRQLRTMSHKDQLTGLGNRYALDEYLLALPAASSIAIVFCDITGLKRINDDSGHREGDRLILRSVDCLKRSFPSCGLFRTGGDELLVICPRIKEEELEEHIRLLRKDMSDQQVTMAIGSIWHPGGNYHFETLLRKAEERMYEDKAAYYRAKGLNRRR
ncbi:MAG: sensor domain-containing diguanylate cyclase [Eubacteriales bacterium]|nr:sensor domain-containing diguanylate cyclase [Eubacteriales bacterium]